MCIWQPDADAMDFDSKALDVVYETLRIKSYMNSTNALGISGIKGQGKTFLLKAKRKRIQARDGDSILVMPKDSVMIDTLDSDIRIDSSKRNYLSSYTNWVSLWKLAIMVTILQHPDIKASDPAIEDVLKKCCKATLSLFDISNSNHRPSVIVYGILELDNKEMGEALQDVPTLLRAASYLQRPISVFIDKVDQAFTHDVYIIQGDTKAAVGARNASIWQYSQLSLANAAYDILTGTNRHIKVNFSIRQEALMDAEQIASNVYRNMRAYITVLEYSKDDLREMFALYVRNEADSNLKMPEYKTTNPAKAFLGIDCLLHGYVKTTEQVEEDVFDYLYRHSVGRPYDIMRVCQDLFFSNVKTLDVDQIKHTVNSASRDVVKQYIAEIRPFSFIDHSMIEPLLSGIGTNIFNFDYMRQVCHRYMLTREAAESCKMNCSVCDSIYPFSQLYNIGLLGYLYKNQSNDSYEQRFVDATNRIVVGNAISIEQSELYLLHPCVSDMARELRKRYKRHYANTDKLIVGNKSKCSAECLREIKKEMADQCKVITDESIFISSTIKDLPTHREAAADALYGKGYYAVYCESPEYSYSQFSYSHDSCIDELRKCGGFITILGTKYGSVYHGAKYQKYATEIVEKSFGLIEQPSITLMEYYTGRKLGLPFLLLVDSAVANHRNSPCWDINKSLPWNEKSDLDKLATILDFINQVNVNESSTVPEGNMLKFYSDISDMRVIISDFSFGE